MDKVSNEGKEIILMGVFNKKIMHWPLWHALAKFHAFIGFKSTDLPAY